MTNLKANKPNENKLHENIKPEEKKSTATRNFIVQTAFKLFLLKSFRDVTMQDLVQATKLSKGAFYHHFKNKEELFLEVLEKFYLFDVFEGQEKTGEKGISLKDFYHQYIEHLRCFIEEIKNITTISYEITTYNVNYFVMIFEGMRRFPEFKQKSFEAQKGDLAVWQKIIQNAVETAEIHPKMDIAYLAKIFLQTVDATFLQAIAGDSFNEALQNIKDIWDNLYEEISG